MLRTAVHVVWALIVVGYLLLVLWSFLEKAGDKVNPKGKHEAKDTFKQLIFLICVVAACFLIDFSFLDSVIMPWVPSFLPRDFMQIILLPAMFYIGALVTGGSKPVRVEKGTRPGQAKGKKRKVKKRRK